MATKHTHGPNFGRHMDGCPRCAELRDGAAPATGSNRPRPASTPAVTKHNHQVAFGRRVENCPRCTELNSGAEPVRWASSRRQQDARRAAEIRNHDCAAARCSVVCTYGDW